MVAPSGQSRTLAHKLNLSVNAGEVVAVLGPSGSGKSTLLKIIAGLEAPDSGQVLFGGVDLARTPTHRRGFALMFQDFALFPHLDVLGNVAFGLMEQRVNASQARQRAFDMLQVVGLAALTAQKVWTLSGGEQQRVALARALITQPRLLLLDEPFSALDTHLRSHLREEFSRRIESAGIATVLVTHDAQEARTMAARGFQLDDGRLTNLW
ncbi:MAG: ATP-binding cassette domain-containing protein [Polaromonas sp.]|nr:MAG: ATP-binding cassette domain-containing protein [Polaromonas sp.]